jgi:hypothetical protein
MGGEIAAVTEPALEWRADASRSTGGAHHPGSLLKRRSMPDVLVMAAAKLCDPIAISVLVVAGDLPLHQVQPTTES